MKRMMSRMLALIVALSILVLPGAALAEDRNCYTLTLSNFELSFDGESIILPLSLSVGGAVEGERGALTASVGAGQKVAAAAIATLEDGEIRATLDGLGYNLYAPLAQVEELITGELGVSLGEETLTAEMDSEMTAKLEALLNAYVKLVEEAANADSATTLNLPEEFFTAEGEEEITLYGETMTATKLSLDTGDMTLNEFLNMSVSTEASREYMDAYKDFMSYMLEQGDADITLEEVLEMFTLRYSGVLYVVENGVLGEIECAVTVEDETITIPVSITALGDEENMKMDLLMPITADDETLTMQISVTATENADVTSVQYDLSASMEADESIEVLRMSFSALDDADGVALNISFNVNDGVDDVALALQYAGTHMATTAEADSWDGSLSLSAQNGDELYAIAMATNLTATNLPEGDLLARTDADLNVLDMSEEDANKLAADAQNVLMQALGALMEDPTLAALLTNVMSNAM